MDEGQSFLHTYETIEQVEGDENEQKNSKECEGVRVGACVEWSLLSTSILLVPWHFPNSCPHRAPL